MKVNGFDWDDGNREKCGKHGLSLPEIESVFTGAPRVGPDPLHSRDEDRFRAIGKTSAGRYAFVVFTLRRTGGDLLIRPISARYMHTKEVQSYERQTEE